MFYLLSREKFYGALQNRGKGHIAPAKWFVARPQETDVNQTPVHNVETWGVHGFRRNVGGGGEKGRLVPSTTKHSLTNTASLKYVLPTRLLQSRNWIRLEMAAGELPTFKSNSKICTVVKRNLRNVGTKLWNLFLEKLSRYWKNGGRFNKLWNSTLCCQVDIVCCDVTEVQVFCWPPEVGRPHT
jgi:hypothetical protein